MVDNFNYLFGNLVADPAVDSLALALIHLLGVNLGHEGTVPPGLLLALPDGNLLAGLAVQLLAINLGHLDTLVLGLILKKQVLGTMYKKLDRTFTLHS